MSYPETAVTVQTTNGYLLDVSIEATTRGVELLSQDVSAALMATMGLLRMWPSPKDMN